MTTSVPFWFVDVFASKPLAGNPLALVPDADDLTEAQMRAIAREFAQSETTFGLRPTLPGANWRLRSFTLAGAEVGGAGHNALGAWLWLAAAGRLPVDALTGLAQRAGLAQEIAGQVLPVEITDGEPVIVWMQQSPPSFGAQVSDRHALASALGVADDDIAAGAPAQVVDTGAGHLLVRAVSRAAVDRARPDAHLLARLVGEAGGEGCYLYALDPGTAPYARFFNPVMGISEDPATGTAAGPLAALLAVRGEIPAEASIVIEQGYAMGRPCQIRVSVSGPLIRVGGSGLIVAEGSLTI
jgi:trans-2,3-dihydro-3-hydroxyanthranilate isomerase